MLKLNTIKKALISMSIIVTLNAKSSSSECRIVINSLDISYKLVGDKSKTVQYINPIIGQIDFHRNYKNITRVILCKSSYGHEIAEYPIKFNCEMDKYIKKSVKKYTKNGKEKQRDLKYYEVFSNFSSSSFISLDDSDCNIIKMKYFYWPNQVKDSIKGRKVQKKIQKLYLFDKEDIQINNKINRLMRF